MIGTVSPILELLGNSASLDLRHSDRYAAILGESPSKGAKSPSLWNRAFEKAGSSTRMVPMDVPSEKLKQVVNTLRNDKRYMGGAVTMPYKVLLLPLLDRIEPEAQAIGAVNCIFREGSSLVGTNTDGAGALSSLKEAMKLESLAGKTIAVLGTGGAGCSVATYMAGAVGSTGKIILSNRHASLADDLAKRLMNQAKISVAPWLAPFENVDVVINCTAIGFETLRQDERGAYSLRPFTPLGPIDSELRVKAGPEAMLRYLTAARKAIERNLSESFQKLETLKNTWVFDIVYQPKQTQFLHMASWFGLPTLSGAGMNLEQAVIAFHKTTAAAGEPQDLDSVRKWMAEIW